MSFGKWPWLSAVGLLLVACVVFSPLLRCQFLNWDDPTTIQHNPRLFPTSVQGLLQCWSETQGHLYVPVTYTVWWVVAAMAQQPNAAWFHALNVLIHLIAIAGVFAVLRLIGFGRISALLGAAIFAMHPVQVEAVAWCSGTKDLLAGAMGIWAIYLAGQRRMVWGTVLFALALLAKPSAIVFPLIAVILLPAVLPARQWKILVAIWLLLSVPIMVIGRLAQPASVAEFVVPLYARPAIALDAVGFYLQKIFWPIHLSSDYGHSPLFVLASGHVKRGIVIVLILGGIIWLRRDRWRSLFIGAMIFVVGLLPVLGFLPFDFQSYSTTADHYLYVPMLGVAIIVACLARYRVMALVLILVIGFLGARACYQCTFWRDSIALFSHDLQVNPRSLPAHLNLAIALAERHDWPAADEQYHQVLALNFAHSRAQLGVGQLLAMQGQTQKALAHMRLASRLEADDPVVHYDLAVALAAMDHADEAIGEYQKALAIEPNFAAAHTNLGTLLLARGDLAGAEKQYRAALKIDPRLAIPQQGLDEISRLRQR
ncbi:MAG TPA: tetratricopeptide repeat protein [Tepidisphaeraceae bacterium]|jgi:hypothetical protein